MQLRLELAIRILVAIIYASYLLGGHPSIVFDINPLPGDALKICATMDVLAGQADAGLSCVQAV